ncbi:glycosyltransferase [Nocardioides panacisoli]|uniref:Glycosyltransferase family 2 protein n=1 Tax=Nocardioides panacisoli TaxID=627624 RepID=A0ABP7IMH3_9ACTN
MLHIVIPALDEERRLPRTLRELRRHVRAHRAVLGEVRVVVVDNGSSDRTAEVARAADHPALPVRVISCPVRGKGAAVRAGLLACDADPDDLICFMDADGATGLDALEEAWRQIVLGADVVIGSRGLLASVTEVRTRRVRAYGAAWYRRFAGRLLPGLADTQCGFKVFRAALVQHVARDLVARGFSFDVELLVRLSVEGARIEEIPVTWVDVPGSTFVPLRHGAGAFAELAGIAWRTRRLTPTFGRKPSVRRVPLVLSAPAALLVTLVGGEAR